MFKDRRLRASAICVVTELTLGAFRVALALITGSLALTADGVHALSDVWISLVLFLVLMLRVSNDHKQRFSERFVNRIESSAVIFSAVAVLAAAIAIFNRLYKSEPPQIENLWIAIVGTAIVMVVLYFLAKLKQRVGRETNSVTLEADGYHSKADMITSGAVLVSLIGTLAGIHLDRVLAVIIAAMVALLGVELLISGFRSLLSSKAFDQLSLVEWCGSKLAKIPFAESLKKAIRAISQYFYCLRYWFAVGAGIAYLSTAVTLVPLGFVGQQTFLGKQTAEDVPTGIYVHAPWPMGEMTLLREGLVQLAKVGLEPSAVAQRVSDGAWFGVSERTRGQDNAGYLHTGDQNLIFASGELLYKITSPTQAMNAYPELDVMITELANAALWELVGRKSYQELIQGDRQVLADQLFMSISNDVTRMSYPVELVSFSFDSIQPPGPVVKAYRKLHQARQRKQDLVNQASTEKVFQLSEARSNAVQILAQDTAYAHSVDARTQGDVKRLNLLADSYTNNPEAFKLKRQNETVQSTLAGQPLTITDPRFDKHDYRIWSAKP
ncbi:cation transporter [Paraferrimonas sedimenticola]|uniref:Uncharacterized protein n=1 Tax=Paraferrimonas sedimenticola TaxID=375674 RepID=A0AA37RZ49_9GAMM|nr:cation transporter [Paraferrimonas sedimenticola]GLP98046.1 hypothetical protein GCM10007895_33530 [Paraferrimonas sedimenticola]